MLCLNELPSKIDDFNLAGKFQTAFHPLAMSLMFFLFPLLQWSLSLGCMEYYL